MQIHNAVITGSFSYNGADLSNVTSSNAYSASLSSRTSNLETTSSVLVGASSSFSSILTSVSSSQQQISASLLNVIAIGATTGSNSFRANQSITGSLTVTGQIIAQSLNVQQVTSSIVFSSGSNTFGCDLNSRQTFTGSVNITGSLIVNTTGPELQVTNNGVVLGNLLTDNHNITGSLRVTGSATFTSTVTAGGNFNTTADGGAGGLRLTLNNTGAGEVQYVVLSGGSAGTGFFGIRNGSTGTNLFLMNGSGATTFASSICATSALFNGNAEINVNQNSLTRLLVRNTTAGTGAYVETSFQVDSSGGAGAVGKYSSSTNAYKIIPASSTYLYNSGAGDISILNDFSSGAIRLAAGGSSSAHLAIASTGAASFSTRLGVGITSDQTYASLFVGGDITTGINQYAIIADPQLSGTSNSYALFANARIKASTAVTNAFGVYIPSAEKLSGATITNNYALYIANQTSGATLNYSIYSSGGLNYFGGNVGIGTASPSYALHVEAPSNSIAGYFKAGGTVGYAALAFTGNGGSNIGVLTTSSGCIIIGRSNGSVPNQFGANLDFLINCANGNILINSSLGVAGSVSKGSGSFKIKHPLASKKCTHQLVHSFIEGPQADLIYRGKINLESGIACVNIDCASRMTEGTFEALNRCSQVFTTNESSWDAIRGKLYGNILVIESQNTESQDEVSWMVIGERQDEHMYETEWTDETGRVITEPEVE